MRFIRRPIRRASLTVLISLLAAVLPVLMIAPARATVGVDDYPDRLKYAAQDSIADPWNFWNRECTSFVAWRLNNDAKVPFHNYYLGPHWGNASNWAYAARQVGIPVDSVPNPGAVAWWAAGSAGSSRGHVAWVRSVSSTAIVIEEYNYVQRGKYSQRTISKTSSSYPTGFIHLGPAVLKATARPVVTGTPQVGVRISGSAGTWSPTGATYTYQWYANGVAVPGATYRTFLPRAAHVGQSLQLAVTATKSGYRATTARSAKTAAVAPGVLTNSAPPAISGTPQVGVQLTATPGTWSPTATNGYQWLANGTPIAGATTSVLTPTAAERGRAISVRVTAARTGYTTATSTSSVTSAVAPGVFTNSAPPSIAGTPQVGIELAASPGAWSPSATYGYQWLADGTPIAGATASTFIPTADQLRATISVQVTARQDGYTDMALTSPATAAVAPGTFLNTVDPTVVGTAKVGVPLSVNPGQWSPSATFDYQWLADGEAIEGANAATYTPTPAEYQRKLAVQVSAMRRGYLTALVTTAPTAATLPGTITSTAPPQVSGRPYVGATLRAGGATWSVPLASVAWQWLADGSLIAGATAASYSPTESVLGKVLSVRATATSPGYTATSVVSGATAPVVFGRVAAASPVAIKGRAVTGELLTASLGALTPSSASVAWQWYRSGVPIEGATRPTYLVRGDDVTSRLSVRATMSAPDWLPTASGAATADRVLAMPRVAVRSVQRGSYLVLRFVTVVPGFDEARGVITVLRRGEPIGQVRIVDGHGRLRLGPFRRGELHLGIAYDAGRWAVPYTSRETFTIS